MLGAEPGSQWTLGNVVSALPPGARTRPGSPRFHFLLPFAQKRTDFMEQLILNTNLGNGGGVETSGEAGFRDVDDAGLGRCD